MTGADARIGILGILLLLACARADRSDPPIAERAAWVAAPSPREDAPCIANADCAITRVPAGGCCPTLCDGRAVTARRAGELDAAASSCRPACAEPQCAPQTSELVAVCRKGSCAAERESMQ